MKRLALTFASVVCLVVATGCPVGVGEISCVKDDNCPTGMYCGADGICGEGIQRDAGNHASDKDTGHPGDAGKDAGKGKDASIEDAGYDGGTTDAEVADVLIDSGEDSGHDDAGGDADEDTGVTDTGIDGGTDTGTNDVGADAGSTDASIEIESPQSSIYQGAAGICESNDYIVRSVTGWTARQVMTSNDYSVSGTVLVK